MALRRNTNAARRYVVKKELKMVVVAGILLGYFAFAWIPFVVFEFYTIHCVATHTLWESCESNCYIRSTCLLTYLLTYLLTCLPFYFFTYLPNTHLPTNPLTNPPTQLLATRKPTPQTDCSSAVQSILRFLVSN